jgi:hypothetical protein
MQEVGGSIPPGSTSLLLLRERQLAADEGLQQVKANGRLWAAFLLHRADSARAGIA